VSGRERIVKPPDCGLDAAPYLLGALAPDEARAFARHLECCAVCRDEVASLAPVIDALPGSAPPREIRPALRRRMLRAVRAEPKVRTARAVAVTRRRFAPTGWLALGMAVAAAVLVVAVSLLHAHARARLVQASLGRAELRVSGGHAELIVAHLAPLPGSRIYELWLQSGSRTIPSTLFAVTARGRADLGVPGDLHGVSRLLVTEEPRGGSDTPTTRAVIQVPLSNVRRS
jgi:anti-sigma-K factor RskA